MRKWKWEWAKKKRETGLSLIEKFVSVLIEWFEWKSIDNRMHLCTLCFFSVVFMLIQEASERKKSMWIGSYAIWSGKFFLIWWCNQFVIEETCAWLVFFFLFFCSVSSIDGWQFSSVHRGAECVLCNAHIWWNSQEWKRTPIINTKHDHMKSNKELTQRQTHSLWNAVCCVSL